MGPIVQRRRTQTAAVQDMRQRYNLITVLYTMLQCRLTWKMRTKVQQIPMTLFTLTYGRSKRSRKEMVQLCVIKYQPKGGISKMTSSTITWVRHSKIYYVVHVDLPIEAVRARKSTSKWIVETSWSQSIHFVLNPSTDNINGRSIKTALTD